MSERERNAEGDIRLTTVGRPEAHRAGSVEHDPGHEDPLRELHPNVGLLRPRRHVPVDLPDVVSRHVRADLCELASPAEQARPVIAGEKPVDPASDGQLERPQQRLGHRARAGTLRRLEDTERP